MMVHRARPTASNRNGQRSKDGAWRQAPGRFLLLVLAFCVGASFFLGGCGATERDSAAQDPRDPEGNGGASSSHEATESADAGGNGSTTPAAQASVLLVVDSSGSMADAPEGYETTKWNALTGALSSSLAALPATIWLGLELFPTTAAPGTPIPYECGDSGRCCEMPSDSAMNVSVGPLSEGMPMITQVLGSREPAGGTPTTAALQRARDYFNGDGQALPGDRFVVLITDGAPNCNPDIVVTVEECPELALCTIGLPPDPCPPPGACPDAGVDADAALEAVQALHDSGVRTIVVGLPGSDEYYTDLLNELATVGAHPNLEGDFTHYAAVPGGGVAELEATIDTALASVLR